MPTLSCESQFLDISSEIPCPDSRHPRQPQPEPTEELGELAQGQDEALFHLNNFRKEEARNHEGGRSSSRWLGSSLEAVAGKSSVPREMKIPGGSAERMRKWIVEQVGVK